MAKCDGEVMVGPAGSPYRRPVRVVGALVEDGDRVLVTRRRKEQAHGGYWEFPGGKVESGESDEEALARELEEELEVRARVGEHVCTVRHAYASGTVELAIYRCTLGGRKPVCREVASLRWVAREDLPGLELTPPDRVVANLVLEEGGA